MRSRQAAVPFILITILLDMLGVGLVIPVLPKLVIQMYDPGAAVEVPGEPTATALELAAAESGEDQALTTTALAQTARETFATGGADAGLNRISVSRGAWVYGWFVASYSLMQFLFAPILGNLSDAYGRRPVLLISLFGSAIDYVLLAFAPDLIWLFIGRIVSGITGANITAANAYIADVSLPENRARNFGLVGACFGLGFIIGPALGGLLGHFGVRVPFLAAALLTAGNWLYGCFVLPESHMPANRRPFVWSRVNPFGSLRVLARYPMVLGLVAVISLERLAHASLPSTWVLYTAYRFAWEEWQHGLSLALVGLMFAVVQGGLTGAVVRRIGEYRAVILGLIVASVSFLLYGIAPAGWVLLATIVFSSLGGVAGPSIQALISHSVPANEQGALQGSLTSISGIAAIVGPLLYTGLFSYFTSSDAPVRVPGIAFLTSSALVALATVMAVMTARKVRAAGTSPTQS